MDIHKNFARSTLSAGIAAGAGSFTVATGEGARFAAGPQYISIWNSTDYACADLDPNKEIVRVSSRATDTFTISAKGQGGTSDVAHNTGGKTYTVQQCLIGDEFDTVVRRLGSRHWRMCQPKEAGDTSTMGMGVIAYGSSSTIAPTATEPVMVNYATSGAINTNAGLQNNGNMIVRTGRNIYLSALVKLQEITTVRAWVGFTFTSSGQMDSDSLAGNDIIAFRFSTNVPDTNWQCVTRSSSTGSQTTTNSGVAASTSVVHLEIFCDDVAGNVKFYINGTLVATNTTNIPASGNNFQCLVAEQALAATTRNIRIGWIIAEDDL